MTHGLCSRILILPDEDPQEFEQLLNQLTAEHKPANPSETALVSEMADQYWRLQRVRRHEDSLWACNVPLDNKELQLCYRYSTKHERAFYKALKSLKDLQKQRLAEGRVQANGLSKHFVSQKSKSAADRNHFVSQNASHLHPEPHFVSQNPEAPLTARPEREVMAA